MMARQTPPEVIREASELMAQMRSVQFATVAPDAAPLASYAPFVQVEGALYVYLSRLAQHARNLRATPLLSAMLIRDEGSCADVFARPRLILDCLVTEHPREGALFMAVLDAFEKRHGETAAIVRELTDFAPFCLHPRAARLISGFARAVNLDNKAMQAVFGAAFSAPPAIGKE
jgi:putative heme iron utilization protein